MPANPLLSAMRAIGLALAVLGLSVLGLLPGAAAAQDLFTGGIGQAQLSPGRYVWNDDPGAEGSLSIAVSLPQQMLYVFRGETLVGMAAVSTGSPGRDTPAGDYQILQKAQWHRSNLYSDAPMPFMQRLTWDGIAIHAGENPGYPASHGCIRVPTAFARKLFAATQLGVRVAVGDFTVQPQPQTQPEPPAYLTVDLNALDGGGPEMIGGGQPHWAAWARIEAVRNGATRLDYAPQVFVN
ncbi:MAG TPA: L,D-transpeptidase family protein [Sphingobium sp.]